MTDLIEPFHFLRPQWLWLVLPLLALVWWYFLRRSSQSPADWKPYVDAHLLKHLTVSTQASQRKRYLPYLAMVAVVFLLLAIAGPTWKKADVPTFSSNQPTVLVLSLAQSMNADDVKPSRLKRSIHKIRDILAKTQGDERGLVIYSDTAFIAAPLTDDAKIIEQMLPELSTTLMPVLGNRPDVAIDTAAAMLSRANARRGRIILLTDSVGDKASATEKAVKAAKSAGYTVSILGVGTKKGAVLQTADGRKITSNSGQTLQTALPVNTLKTLAADGGGEFSLMTATNQDVNQLLLSVDKPFEGVG